MNGGTVRFVIHTRGHKGCMQVSSHAEDGGQPHRAYTKKYLLTSSSTQEVSLGSNTVKQTWLSPRSRLISTLTTTGQMNESSSTKQRSPSKPKPFLTIPMLDASKHNCLWYMSVVYQKTIPNITNASHCKFDWERLTYHDSFRFWWIQLQVSFGTCTTHQYSPDLDWAVLHSTPARMWTDSCHENGDVTIIELDFGYNTEHCGIFKDTLTYRL